MPNTPYPMDQIYGANQWTHSTSINNAQPILAGAGLTDAKTVRIEIDGVRHEVPVDESGVWDWAAPQGYGDGNHTVKLTAIDEQGNESEPHEFEVDVDADPNARQRDAKRVEEWNKSGSDKFHELNATPPEPITGAAGEPKTEEEKKAKGAEKGNSTPEEGQQSA